MQSEVIKYQPPSGGRCSHPGREAADPEAGPDRRRAAQAEP